MKTKIISGIMVTMFLVTMVAFAIPVRVSAQFTGDPVYVGLIGPKGWIQWDGIKEGAELARDLINAAGGIRDAVGDTHELRLVEIDEHAVPVPDPTAAVTELLTALEDTPTMKQVIGGFRTECVLPMREAAMDYAAVNDRPIWTIAGAATDELIDDGPLKDNPFDDVREDYDRYKYMFRATPINSTNLATQLLYMAAQLIIPKLKGAFGIPLTSPLPTYIVAEDLIWCEAIVAKLRAAAPALGAEIVGVGRPSAIETDFGPIFDGIEEVGAKMVIHIFSAVAGATFIKQWGERKVTAAPVGINVESQMQEFYASVKGKCEYEVIMASVGTRTNLNPRAKPLNAEEFWDAYQAEFGHAPIYTAWGVYSNLMEGNRTAPLNNWPNLDCSDMIPLLETQTAPNGLFGYGKVTNFHDVYCDKFCATPVWPSFGAPPHNYDIASTVRAMLPQWQAGRMEVIWPRGYWAAPNPNEPPLPDPTPLPFARKYRIPPWVYSLGETDFAGPYSWPTPPIQVGTTPPGFFGYLPLPDGTVGQLDIDGVTGMWQKTCWWTMLEADMDNNNFIDIDDVARVALDWGKTA